ncbi:MAG: extracellular solute-binding protein [Firmicutes bacterium]|nr:extracellular solute-binding protein [Bacillota bacterium]
MADVTGERILRAAERGAKPKVYGDLKGILKNQILTGRLRQGDRIPSDRELAAVFGISRASVRNAIAELVGSGLLEKVPRKGVFVGGERELAGERSHGARNRGRITLRLGYLTAADRITIDLTARIGRLFERANPHIGVEMCEGECDVVQIEDAVLPYGADAGELLPLDDFVGAEKELDLADFFGGPLGQVCWNGKLYALPRVFSPVVMFYNRALFDRLGVPYPQAGWTWEDFLEKALRLTVAGPGSQSSHGFGWSANHKRWVPWIWRNGGDLFDARQCEGTVDSPEAVEAVRFYADLANRHRVTSPIDTRSWRGGNRHFLTGTVGMIANGCYQVPEYADASFPVGVVPLPRRKVEATSQPIEAYAIPTRSRCPELAWEFIKFVVGVPAQEHAARAGYAIPVRRSVALEEALRQPFFSERDRRMVFEQIEFGRSTWSFPSFRMLQLMTSEMESVWLGQEEALRVCRRLKRTLDAVILTQKEGSMAELRAAF